MAITSMEEVLAITEVSVSHQAHIILTTIKWGREFIAETLLTRT